MKSSLKKIILILLIIILVVLSILQIRNINSKQHVDEVHTYKIGETFEYNDFQVKVAAIDFYSAADMKSMYAEIPEEMLVENELIIKAEIKNMADDKQSFNITPLTLQVGIEKGSAIDPYVYPYLNPELSGSVVLEKEEKKTVMLAFPIEKTAVESKEQIKLILSLYPKKYEVNLYEEIVM